jgi:AcrR family transcriptional regulator
MPLPRFEKLDPPRRKAILAAAAEEFGERGFEAASYNRIIDRAGISKGAMYYYFADKDDLYRTVLDAALTVWVEHVAQPFEASDRASFWQGCVEMYERTLRFLFEDPQSAAVCLSITRARERLEGHPALLELNQKMMQWVEALVCKGREVGAVRSDLPLSLLVQVGLSLIDAGDRWLASNWSEFSLQKVETTAAMMVGLFRRIGEPEVDVDECRSTNRVSL